MPNRKVSEICTLHEVEAGAPNRELESAFLIMKLKGFRRLPITKIGKIIGILSIEDLLRAISEKGLPDAVKATVSEYMTPNPVTINVDASFKEAARTLVEYDIGSLIVVGQVADKLQGILTAKDILHYAAEVLDTTVQIRDLGELITKELETVDEGTDVMSAVRLMVNKEIHRLVVLNNDQPVGVMTANDVITFVVSQMEEFRANPNFLDTITVKFVVNQEPMELISVTPETTVGEVLKLMEKHGFGAIPVIENERLVGMFTENVAVQLVAKL